MVQRVGIIGCGNIAPTYVNNRVYFPEFAFTCCADEQIDKAEGLARASGTQMEARAIPRLLDSDDVDIVLNLTPATVHHLVTREALRAGKHVYSEKPLAIDFAVGRELLRYAESASLRLGVAPDTFLGPAVQRARALVRSGALGEVIHGLATFMTPGMESWHPNPAPFYKKGGGPMLDLGPYAVAALIEMLGPVGSVRATGRIGRPERIARASFAGEKILVEVPTTVHATLLFTAGAQITLLGSFDAPAHSLPPIELYGVSAALKMPYVHAFGGELVLTGEDGSRQVIDTSAEPFGKPNSETPIGKVADYRGLGLAEMARSIELGVPHRASGQLGLHILEILTGIDASLRTGEAIAMASGFG